MKPIKLAMFDAKEYDIESFNQTLAKESPSIEITYFETKLNKLTATLTKGFDAVCIFVNDEIDKETIDILVNNKIELILLRCAGYNNVDVKYAQGKIAVMRVPSYSPHAIAEHAFAMLLTSIRRIHKAYIRTRDNNFSLNNLVGTELYGKTVGVIGTGKIGKAFIEIAKGFGMRIIAYDAYPSVLDGVEYVPIDKLYQLSDIITLHCPLTNDNVHMINSKTIEQMKKGVIIINTSRGLLINSEDLLNGIKQRKIGAACLDVYEEETNIFFNDNSGHILNDDTLSRLISMPNVIVTSHQAYLTKEALENIAKTTIENALNYFDGAKSVNEVTINN